MLQPSSSLFRAEYARRMNKVLDHIDRHLDAPLELAQLADVAHFSRFHFHRVFTAWMGETLGDYARRRRLETAAFRLTRSDDDSVLQIALSTGFGSGEAFARAFKLKFGCTPSQWRAGIGQHNAMLLEQVRLRRQPSNPDQALNRALPDDGSSFTSTEHSMEQLIEEIIDVSIVDLAPARVAFLRHIGPYGPALGTFWRTSVAPWVAAHGLDNAMRYGIGHDDPSITAPDKCRYDACVEVPDDFRATGQAGIAMLPGGPYAVARFHGPTSALPDAWMTLSRAWLPDSGMQWDERPCFERFTAQGGLNPASGLFSCDICIPLRPL